MTDEWDQMCGGSEQEEHESKQRAAELWAALNIAGVDGSVPDAATIARVTSAYRSAVAEAEQRGRSEPVTKETCTCEKSPHDIDCTADTVWPPLDSALPDNVARLFAALADDLDYYAIKTEGGTATDGYTDAAAKIREVIAGTYLRDEDES